MRVESSVCPRGGNHLTGVIDNKGLEEKEEMGMYEKILVPLDGSELAECVFPHVKVFIEECHTSHVIFVRVLEVAPAPAVYGDYITNLEILEGMESALERAAKDYLDQVVSRFQHEGTKKMHTDVLFGRATESLADYAKINDIDLILIATHGRSRVTRCVRGSVAYEILRSSNIPVLMVRSPGIQQGI